MELVELAEGVFVISLIAGPRSTCGSALVRIDRVIMRSLKIFPLVMDILVVTRVLPFCFRIYVFRGWSCRLMFLRQNFSFFLDYDVVSCLVDGIMDRPWFVEGYSFSEFRLVPERLPERVDGHFVAYPAYPGHHQLESSSLGIDSKDRHQKFPYL